VTFDEDRSQVRCDNIPQVMAALRNTVIALTQWGDETKIAAACRRFTAQPACALALIGIQLENWMALGDHWSIGQAPSVAGQLPHHTEDPQAVQSSGVAQAAIQGMDRPA